MFSSHDGSGTARSKGLLPAAGDLGNREKRKDHAQPRPQLGPLRGLLPPVARRHCVAQHFAHRFACQPKLQRYCTLALAFDSNCPSSPPIEFHLVHPSGVPRSPPLRQEPAKLRSGGLVLPRRLTPLPRRNAVYFCSGAYNLRRKAGQGVSETANTPPRTRLL